MRDKSINVLLIEDSPAHVVIIREMLKAKKDIEFNIVHVKDLSEGLNYLTSGDTDIVLLDLGLPDSTGIETFDKIHAQDRDIPIVVITANADDELAIEAVQKGAQDYLVKEQTDSDMLIRSVRYAIERNRMYSVLRGLVLIDDLTGLYNRRGFIALGKRNIKLADRTKKRLLFGIADLDGLKLINDSFGHKEGDRALLETVQILKETFRETDIIARMGGDEFAIIAIEASIETANVVTARLKANVDRHNLKKNPDRRLSISIGVTFYEPGSHSSIDELISKADELMYMEKNAKREP
jgi:diguanylate cyclase (GGDEF)-like protein